MATTKATADFILNKLRHPEHFSVRSMFGEFALYANGKTVGFICDNLLYVKILPASKELEPLCEPAPPYPGAKLYYLVEETQLSTIPNLPAILFAIAESTPVKKKRVRK
jgi:TfoX/Sxy family transcriptional regulator of competence genes